MVLQLVCVVRFILVREMLNPDWYFRKILEHIVAFHHTILPRKCQKP